MIHSDFRSRRRNARKIRTAGETSDRSVSNDIPDNGKRQLIIRKAITLFANLGYDNVRISDITNSIDIAKGTLYLYFKTKKDLLMECFGELNRLLQILETRDEIRNEKNIFRKNSYRWIGFAERYSDFGGILNLLRTACGSNDEEIRAKARKTFDVIIEPLRRDIANGIKNGYVSDVDPELASYYLLGAAESLAFRLDIDNRYTIKEIGEVVYRFNLKALASEKEYRDPEKSCDDILGTITDISGTSNEIRQIRFAGKTFLAGKIGQGEIIIDTSKISLIEVQQTDSKCHGRIHASDGTCKEIDLDSESVISGESPLGTLRIPTKNVSRITFSDPYPYVP